MKRLSERFWEKVSGTDKDDCWIWTGSRSGSGYGQFWDGKRNIPAHWFMLPKRPQKGQEACHHCDNKLCVRPSHIFLGTRSDNMKDMVSKKRHNTRPGCLAMLKVRRTRRGSSNHQAVLSEEDASIIKSIKPCYGMGASVAKYFGVSETVVSGIWKGRRWAHITPDATARQRAEAFLRTIGKWRD